MAELKKSFDGIRVKNFAEAYKVGLGAFCFTARDESLLAMMPDKDGNPKLHFFNISEPSEDPYWSWDGNREKPTLSPSLHWPGNWHGFLRAGRFESC